MRARGGRPVMLDLFCCEGGAGKGYADAGFTVVGVDKDPMPRYPFEFVQADALDVLADRQFMARFDAVHASPTCQRKARVTDWRGSRESHPDTLTPTLELLAGISLPWVVENVPEACPPLRADYMLCATNFGLQVRRHRAFMTGNWTPPLDLLPPCRCWRNPHLLVFEHGGSRGTEREWADAMGCHWMSTKGGRQAIPPAFTAHIGSHLLATMEGMAA